MLRLAAVHCNALQQEARDPLCIGTKKRIVLPSPLRAWPSHNLKSEELPSVSEIKWHVGRKNICFQLHLMSVLVRWYEKKSHFLYLQQLQDLGCPAECQVFSNSASLPACHKLSAGHSHALFKVQHRHLVMRHKSFAKEINIPPFGLTPTKFKQRVGFSIRHPWK